ncbi:MAG: SIR2 family protein [Candidatus Eisenbacteria bacterium]|nr:SIR2 family protein [Candidatus Eisenbacteria bacterium]
MATSYLKHFPKPLLDDIVAGACVPFVGAGFSRNATLPRGQQMPLWDDLGREIAGSIPDFTYTTAVDALSAFGQEFTRTRLVEELSKALFVGQARPGPAHEAFCQLGFDLVCTTNFDLLLEAGYQRSPWYCRPIVDGASLAVRTTVPGVTLLKFHGDLHHPNSLVVTEEDYDAFTERHAVVATFIANLLISKTPLFIGYSLEDPDFRSIWQVIKDRLGSLKRPAFALTVGEKSQVVRRFERRGVKVINLPGSDRGKVLAAAFTELREYWLPNLLRASAVTTERPLEQLVLPWESATSLCFFAVPASLQSLYKETVFPLAEKHGFVPLTSADVLTPGDVVAAKLDALIERSDIVVVDASSKWTAVEALVAVRKRRRLLVIHEGGDTRDQAVEAYRLIERPAATAGGLSDPDFLSKVDEFFASMAKGDVLAQEPIRLLQVRAYRAAVVAALSLVEIRLRSLIGEKSGRAGAPFRELLGVADELSFLDPDDVRQLREWQGLRNQVVHSERVPTKQVAEQIVRGAVRMAGRLHAEVSRVK